MLKREEFPSSLFKKADVFHTGSAYSYNDYTFDDALKCMERAKKENIFVTYDPNWRKFRIKNERKTRARIKKLLLYVDLLKLSKRDAVGITGAKTLSGALRRLPKNTVVTLGDKGSFFWDGKRKTYHPAFRVRVVDTIGAGDGFTAGLIYRYCTKGMEAFQKQKKETLAFASAISALVCGGRGAAEGLQNLQQVERFLRTR
jgi:fructokinase